MSMNYWAEINSSSAQKPDNVEAWLDTELNYILLIDSVDPKKLYSSDDETDTWVLKTTRTNNIVSMFLDRTAERVYCIEANATTITAFYFDCSDGSITNLTTTAITDDLIMDIFVYNGKVYAVTEIDGGTVRSIRIYVYNGGWTFVHSDSFCYVANTTIAFKKGCIVPLKGYYYIVFDYNSLYDICSTRTQWFNETIIQEVGWYQRYGNVFSFGSRGQGFDYDGDDNLVFQMLYGTYKNAKHSIFGGENSSAYHHPLTTADWTLIQQRQKLSSLHYSGITYGFNGEKTYTLDYSDYSIKEDWDLGGLLTTDILSWSGNYLISTGGQVLKWKSLNKNNGLQSLKVDYENGTPTTSSFTTSEYVTIQKNTPIQFISKMGDVAFRGIAKSKEYNGTKYSFSALSYDKELVITKFSHDYSVQTAKQIMEHILSNYANWLDYSSSIDPDGDFTTTYSINFKNRTIQEAFDLLMDLEDGIWSVDPKGIVYAHALTRVAAIPLGKITEKDFDTYTTEEHRYYGSNSVNKNFKTIAELKTDGWTFDEVTGSPTFSKANYLSHTDIIKIVYSGSSGTPWWKSPIGANKNDGHIDLWLCRDGGSAYKDTYLRDSSNNIIFHCMHDGSTTFTYYDGATPNYYSINAATRWIHLSIDFNGTTNKWSMVVRTYGETYTSPYGSTTITDKNYVNGSAGNFDHVYGTKVLHTSNLWMILDSFGYGWDTDYTNDLSLNSFYLSGLLDDDYTFECKHGCCFKKEEKKDDVYSYHVGLLRIHQYTVGNNKLIFPAVLMTQGFIEGHIFSSDAAEEIIFAISGANGDAIRVRIQNDYLQYYDGNLSSWVNIKAANDNQWYYIVALFECGSNEYNGLGADKYSLYVDGILEAENIDFQNTQTSITNVDIRTIAGTSAFDVYLDGFGSTEWGTPDYGLNPHIVDERSGYIVSIPIVKEIIEAYNTIHLYGAIVAGARLQTDNAGGYGVDAVDVAANGVIEYIDHFPHVNSQSLIDDLSDAILARTGLADNPLYITVSVKNLDLILCARSCLFRFTLYVDVDTAETYYILANDYDLLNDIAKITISSGIIQEGREYKAISQKTSFADEEQIDILAKTVDDGPKNYIHLYDTKSSGTQGGDFYSGAWRTRTLNTEAKDQPSACTLSSNQFTLIAGTYIIIASAPAYYVEMHKLRLYNISDSTTEIIGGQALARIAAATQSDCLLSGQFTITSSKTFELQHYCATTNTANGFGLAMSSGLAERYANVQLWKMA